MTRLIAHSRGFLGNPVLKEMLAIAGIEIVPPWARHADGVAVWGARPVAARGQRAARRRGLPLVHVEDGFLRSVLPGWAERPIGLSIDPGGFHLDVSRPSRLEKLINSGEELNATERARAAAGLAVLREHGLSKFNAPATGVAPAPGYVLVVDQVPGDAAIALGGAHAGRFADMLDAAIAENPGQRVLVRRHPIAARSHFTDLPKGAAFFPEGVPAMAAIDGAARIYCVTSQLGFDAVLRGHVPVVFGGAFYAGWGLTEDRFAMPARRHARPDVEALFYRAMIEFPTWIDPIRRCETNFETAAEMLIARKSAHAQTQGPVAALGMRMWKRSHLRAFFPGCRFVKHLPETGPALVWAGRAPPDLPTRPDLSRLEDGFIRSSGLGAALVPPVSLVRDDLGIYFDPGRESRLERWITARARLDPGAHARAEALRQAVIAAAVSKYNLGGSGPPDRVDDRARILVVGQVEDDASIRLGAPGLCRNIDLLAAARAEAPDAFIAYKPHPDVEIGLRTGAVAPDAALGFADEIWDGVDIIPAIDACDTLVSLTSLAGFEALLRGKKVICHGQPFYAGWGLTEDRAGAPERRRARPTLQGLIHAVLIDYPLYRDPITGLFVRPEDIVARIAAGDLARLPHPMPLRSKLQGLFASFAPYWR